MSAQPDSFEVPSELKKARAMSDLAVEERLIAIFGPTMNPSCTVSLDAVHRLETQLDDAEFGRYRWLMWESSAGETIQEHERDYLLATPRRRAETLVAIKPAVRFSGEGPFKIGDRVILKSKVLRKTYRAMTTGMVVYWHGTHDPKNPRVRWESGWGTSVEAYSIRRMTEKERAKYTPPALIEGDLEVMS